MDLIRHLFKSIFPTDNRNDYAHYDSENVNDKSNNWEPSADVNGEVPYENGPQHYGRHFSPFSRTFEDMWKSMDDSFDEMFKAFGVDNMPMFDPFIPPHEDGPARRQDPSTSLPSRGNVRDYMLRREGEPVHTHDEDINVRSHMLRKPSSLPSSSSTGRSEESKQADINCDSLLKKGGTVNEILDGHHPTPHSADPSGLPQFKFRFRSTTTTRKSDGTIETRRVTRDEKGNEKETVEVKRGSP